MFKNLSKLEKAGLIIGSIECVVGFGISIWASRRVLKQADEVVNKMKEDNETLNNLNDISDKYECEVIIDEEKEDMIETLKIFNDMLNEMDDYEG